MNKLIVKKYTNALFSLSLANNQENLINIQLETISNLFVNSDFKKVFISPLIKKDIKLNFILETLKEENLEDLIIKFITILSQNNRLNLLLNISKYFNQLLEHSQNKYFGTISTNTTITDENIKILEKVIQESRKSNIVLSQKISDYPGFNISIENLGIEISFSKNRIRKDLIDFITKSFIKII